MDTETNDAPRRDSTMGEKWNARTHPKRFVTVLAIVTVLCVLAGVLAAALVN